MPLKRDGTTRLFNLPGVNSCQKNFVILLVNGLGGLDDEKKVSLECPFNLSCTSTDADRQ